MPKICWNTIPALCMHDWHQENVADSNVAVEAPGVGCPRLMRFVSLARLSALKSNVLQTHLYSFVPECKGRACIMLPRALHILPGQYLLEHVMQQQHFLYVLTHVCMLRTAVHAFAVPS